MLTTGTASNESFVATSSSVQFPLLNNLVFSSCDDGQQVVNSEQSAQLQFQQPHMLMQQEPSFKSASDQSSSFSKVATSNRFAPLFQTNVSLSPPSPADSGVVSDSKADIGSLNQDDGGLEERLKLSPNSLNLGNADAVDAIASSLAGINLLNVQDISKTPNDLLQNLIQSNPGTSASSNRGLPANKYANNNCVPISQDLATIWSPPSAIDKSAGYDQALQATMLQVLQEQQQQQQMENWSSAASKPPPGLTNFPLLQKQFHIQARETAQVNGLTQKLPLRRSQSVMLNRNNTAPFLQVGRNDGLDELSEQLLNSSLTSHSSPFSVWTNETQSLSSTNLSTLNSAQLRSGPSAFTKPSFAHHVIPPPKFNRSISTPAKHTAPFSIPGGMGSLDDNPFFQSSAAPSLNGHAAFTGNGNSLRFTDFESTLSEIMKSNAISQQRAFLAAPESTRGLGKWKELGSEPIFEENMFTPSLTGAVPSFLGETTFERFSRKVFVGGLPPDIDEEEIRATFLHFGSLVVDWPHKAESKSYFPPKGYAFLLFKEEISVQNLIRCCLKEGDKLYLRVSSPTIRDKPVQIRPWKLNDSDFVLDGSQSLDPRKTVFVGGVPRPLRAFELAILMDRLYGGVCYAGIDVDPDLKYPKGAGRVAFSNQQSYIAAISARFAHLQHADIDKRVEVKPYVLDDQHCDECQGTRCGGRFAPFFCASVACLRYYCDECWVISHSRVGMESHRPLVKEGAERFARSTIGRW